MDWFVAAGIAWIVVAVGGVAVGAWWTLDRRRAWPLVVGAVPATLLLASLSMMVQLSPLPALILTPALLALLGWWLSSRPVRD